MGREFVNLKLILFDHGNIASQQANAKTIESLPALKISHICISENFIYQKFLALCPKERSLFKTEFVSFFPDDDIPIREGIYRAVKELSKIANAVCAQGYAIAFNETESEFYVGPIEDFVPSIEDESSILRLHNYIRRYQPIYYGI